MKPTLTSLRAALRAVSSPERARINAWFFKTGKGQYGEGDTFLGVRIPDLRVVVRAHADLPLADVARLLDSKLHEERMAGTLLLVRRYQRGDDAAKRDIFKFYLAHPKGINNWDIVDSSAHQIVGAQLLSAGRGTALLDRLAKSKNLWQRRIAVVSTYAFIRVGQFRETFRICDALMKDKHDLLHKACGWMLREAGKRDRVSLEAYLLPRYKNMPRTMLRYAIERFPEFERKRYLKGVV